MTESLLRSRFVTDPQGLDTTYSYNGHNNLITQSSPDTGTTKFGYNATGNVVSKLDAAGRCTATTCIPGTTANAAETIAYTYDSMTATVGGAGGKGRLGQFTDGSGNTKYVYDKNGRIISKAQTITGATNATQTVSYTYNALGQLINMVTPSGQSIGYVYNSSSNNGTSTAGYLGRVSAITMNGSYVIGFAQYQAFGPASGWAWGNHQSPAPGGGSGNASTATYAYPNTTTTPAASRKNTLTGISGGRTDAFTYDATGNTLTESAALAAMNPSTGQINTGSTSSSLTYATDAKNRTSKVQIGSSTANTVTYKINALGQRIQKTGAGTYVYNTSITVNGSTGLSPQALTLNFNQRYVYDEQGRLLGEYSPDGKLIAETIWLDDLPVATIRPKNANNQIPLGTSGTGAATANNTGANTSANPVNLDLYYVHPDHLGTPRVATRSVAVNNAISGPNAVNKAVWRWDSDPFGTSLDNSKPSENPQQVTGTASQVTAASFRVNNRFPGQVFDAESGKQYNYKRDAFDATVGRYSQSDPIGLQGGLSTFSYVGSSPVSSTDPSGLKHSSDPYPHCGRTPNDALCRGGLLPPGEKWCCKVGAGSCLGAEVGLAAADCYKCIISKDKKACALCAAGGGAMANCIDEFCGPGKCKCPVGVCCDPNIYP